MKDLIYCVGNYYSDIDDYPMYNSKIFRKLDDAINYCLSIVKAKGYKFGIKFNEELYSNFNELPENWKEHLKEEDEIEFGYYDSKKDLYWFEEDLIIIVKELI